MRAPLAIALLVAGCHSDPVVQCSSAALVAAGDPVAPDQLGVYVDAVGPDVDRLADDLSRYLAALWQIPPPQIVRGAPDGSKPFAIWLSLAQGTDGYRLLRDGNSLRVTAGTNANLVHGGYALLEQLGIRFFHPKQELVPAVAGPRFPRTLDVARAPWVKVRGLQLHTLHPIEYFKVLNEPGDANLADAMLLIDWLVKTGQNHLQWPLLSTVDFAAWTPHAQAILDYAHSRDVTVAPVVQLWGGSALQHNYVLMSDPKQPPSTMDPQIDRLLALPFDELSLGLGEFTSLDPSTVLALLNHATSYVAGAHPSVLVNVQNHVGNYKNLYLQYMGQTIFFYHLPKYADLALGSEVHTLSFFDLYRDWATYAHPDFHLQHDLIDAELPTGRRVRYFPESAYWISADNDIPAFLPMFVYARWLDIQKLASETNKLEGHVMFSSGHEWGYWLTDYLAAHQLWEPSVSFDDLLNEFSTGFGDCAPEVNRRLSDFTSLQTMYLFDQKLAAYLQGEDLFVDLGYLTGLETHPKRVEFEELLTMAPEERDAFEHTVVDALQAMADAVAPDEAAIAARCRGSDAALRPFCDELDDGVKIVELRLEHTVRLYRAVLAYARGGNGKDLLHQAQSVRDEAQSVVNRREPEYRFDVPRLVDHYDNPTIYPFGYLRQAHTLCYWSRREEQVQTILDSGQGEAVGLLPTCQD